MTRLKLACAFALSIVSGPVTAQDMLRNVDLASPMMTLADFSRADVEAMVMAAPAVALPSESVRSISREEMGALPILRYGGSVQVVAGHPDLVHAMQDILRESVVGFDTETRPAFRPGESYLPSLAQFATASSVYLVQVQQPDVFDAMRQILSSEKIIKVGVSVGDDLRNLKKLFEFDERSVVDLGEVAKGHGGNCRG